MAGVPKLYTLRLTEVFMGAQYNACSTPQLLWVRAVTTTQVALLTFVSALYSFCNYQNKI